MRHASLSLSLLAALSLAAPAVLAQAEADEFVVVLKPNANRNELANAHGAFHRYGAVFSGFAAHLSPQAAEALRNNPNVQSVEPAFTVTANAETLPAGVDRIDAERAHALGKAGAGARVAVVDTGVDLDHPDLAANINLSLSRTFVSRGGTTSGGDDDQGHGTHVAGTIAAVDNDSQVIGVAPSATLVSLKVLNRQGSGSSTDIIAALDFITAHNNAAASYADMIHVANFSIGGGGSDSDSAYRRAFDAAVTSGCFVVVAAGNESDDAANHVPSAYDSVITVSALDPLTDTFASFSNFGADVDIVAPGVNTLSTTMGGSTGTKSGTSMATPHVAGTAALYVGQELANLSKSTAVSTIRAALLGSAEPITMSGDSDGLHEPLADAEAILGPVAPPEPGVLVGLSNDKGSYSDSDTQAVVTASVTDETAAPIEALAADAFVVDGAPLLSFSEIGNGDYAFTLDISGFALNDPHTLTVSATDARALTGSASTTITRSTQPALHVSNISYDSGRRDLVIRVYIVDDDGAGAASASVTVSVTRNGASIGTATSSTDSAGKVTFKVRNASAGTYVTTVTNVAKTGTSYDPSLNFVDPGFTR